MNESQLTQDAVIQENEILQQENEALNNRETES